MSDYTPRQKRIVSLSQIVICLCTALTVIMTLLMTLFWTTCHAATETLSYVVFDTNTMLLSTTSPEGTRTVEAWLLNGGATVAWTVNAYEVTESGRKHIYYQYREKDAEITWLTEDVVCINGVTLDLSKGETWDSESDQADLQM